MAGAATKAGLTIEQELELLALEEEDLNLQEQALQASAVRPKDESVLDTIRGGVEALNQGTMIGAGDEIAAAGRVVTNPIIGLLSGEGLDAITPSTDIFSNIGKNYDTYAADQRRTRDEFADENPSAATVLELAGGFASPINRIAPGVGTKGGFVRRLAESTARGGVEGGIAGFLGADEDRLAGAQTGSLWGGGMSAGLTGIGGTVGRVASRRNVAESLDQIDPDTGKKIFKPIPLADSEEGMVGTLYRQLVGRSWGSKALRDQEQPWLDAAEGGVASVRSKIDDMAAQAKEIHTVATRQLAEDIPEKAAGLVKTTSAAKRAAGKKSRDAINSSAKHLQRTVVAGSLPAHGRSALADVDIDDSTQARNAIKGWWTKNAFMDVKNMGEMPWDQGIKARVTDLLDSDPFLKSNVGNALKKTESLKNRLLGLDADDLDGAELVEALMSGKATGKIVGADGAPILAGEAEDLLDGAVLMELRNVFARGANDSAQGASKSAQRAVASEFDKVIRKLLKGDPDALARFNEELETYATSRAFLDASKKKGVRERGNKMFPGDWLGSSSKYKDMPFEDEAVAAARAAEAAKAGFGRSKLDIDDADKAGKVALAKAKRAAAAKIADAKTAAKTRIDEQKAGPLMKAKARLAEIVQAGVPRGTSSLSSLLTTKVLGAALGGGIGALAGGPMGMAAGITTGIGAANRLSTKGAQRAFAGQTNLQEALAHALRSGDTATITRILSRERARESAGDM